MKIFYPQNHEDCDEDDNTSFTFDDKDEESSFCSWLSDMNLTFVKTKVPVIVNEKMSFQSCVIVNDVETGDEEEDAEEEVAVEEPKKSGRKKKEESE